VRLGDTTVDLLITPGHTMMLVAMLSTTAEDSEDSSDETEPVARAVYETMPRHTENPPDIDACKPAVSLLFAHVQKIYTYR
jgi:hypothetical protein